MSVLVTGVAGFIGSATARALLARGDSVLGIDNLNSYYDPSLKQARLDGLSREFGDRFRFVQARLRRCRRTGGPERRSRIRPHRPSRRAGGRPLFSRKSGSLLSSRTWSGTSTCWSSPGARRSSHFVYASSSSVYGGNETLPFRVEDRVDHPLSLYAATKKADELMSETYAHLYRLPQTGLRFFTVYGPWGRPDMAMWMFTKAIFAGEPIHVFKAAICAATSPISTTSSPASSPASTIRRAGRRRGQGRRQRARTGSTISATTAPRS